MGESEGIVTDSRDLLRCVCVCVCTQGASTNLFLATGSCKTSLGLCLSIHLHKNLLVLSPVYPLFSELNKETLQLSLTEFS